MKTLDRAASAAFLLLCALVVASPAHAAKYKINWLLAHNNLDFFREAADNFKKTVEQGSHGDIAVNIVTAASDGQWDTAGQPGTAPNIAAEVEAGRAEMGHSFTDVMGAVDRRYMAFEAPYLFRGYQHMEGVIDGPVGTEMLDGLRAHHMVGLCFTYSGGGNGVASTRREIRGPEDLKGLKVGVYGDEVNAAWLKSLGATPVAIEHRLGRITEMARDGSLDAVAITWRNFERTELSEDFKYYNMPGSTYLVSMTYMNEDFYNSLPKAYQKLIMSASRKTARIERAKTIELNEIGRRAMEAKGVQPVYLSEQGRAAFSAALKPAYKSAIEPVLGKGLLEKIRATPDGAYPSVLGDFASR